MRRVLLPVALAAALGIACSDTTAPRPPQPGTLTIELTTPNANDAAMLIRVAGPTPVTELASSNAAHVLHQRAADGVVRAAVFGTLASGALATFAVPDVARAAEYTATIVEVGDDGNAIRASLAGYRLVVRR